MVSFVLALLRPGLRRTPGRLQFVGRTPIIMAAGLVLPPITFGKINASAPLRLSVPRAFQLRIEPGLPWNTMGARRLGLSR
jgi:hypothetical protein